MADSNICIEQHESNVFLVNTGMNPDSGERFPLDFTRNTIKKAILTEYPLKDTSGPSLNILVKLMAIISLVFANGFSETSLLTEPLHINN